MVDKQQALAERDILHAMAHTSPHPFTTGLKFAFQSESNLYIGMSYLSGGNLKQLIQRLGHLPETWVCFYAAELVLAIAHLHSMQVLYRCAIPPLSFSDASSSLPPSPFPFAGTSSRTT
jgi:serine/threonine protein kinase